MNLFITQLFEDPQRFFIWLLVVIFSICCHEFMHAWAALKQGDPTAADEGHLTLNPMKQMGPFSLVMLAVCGIAWGRVPVRPWQMRHRHSDALVSLAGPATNFGLFLIFGILFYVCYRAGVENQAALMLLELGSVLNIVPCLFNLLPVPGLDGFAILKSFFPKLGEVNSEWSSGAFLVAFLLLFFVGFRYVALAGGFMFYLLCGTLVGIFG